VEVVFRIPERMVGDPEVILMSLDPAMHFDVAQALPLFIVSMEPIRRFNSGQSSDLAEAPLQLR
jgi:hypothetical protein